MVKYTDNTRMPFGEYKGIALVNVPAVKLIWYYENLPNISPSLKAYLQDNLTVLKVQARQARRLNVR